jgi:predicted nucleic acid-binding protein
VAEFWSIVTHPAAGGRPSTPDEASNFIRALVEDGGARLWRPGPGFADRVMQVAANTNVSGARILDLQIALTAFDNGAVEIWTHDRNFTTVPGLAVELPIP